MTGECLLCGKPVDVADPETVVVGTHGVLVRTHDPCAMRIVLASHRVRAGEGEDGDRDVLAQATTNLAAAALGQVGPR